MRDYKNKSYFIKLPNSEESKAFIKVLRMHFKRPKYRVRIQANRYKETLGESKAWRVYIQNNSRFESEGSPYYDAGWWENLDLEDIPKLREWNRLLSKEKEHELQVILFMKRKYPEVLMEYLMTEGR